MRNIFQQILLLFILIGLFFSCEKTISYDTSNFEKKMAVDALVENGHVKLFLSQNRSTLSKDTVIAVENAEVYINNIKIGENEKDNHQYTHVLAEVKPGDVLNLSVYSDGFQSLAAQAIMPQRPIFKIVSSKIVHAKDFLWYDEYVEFTIQIDENEINTPDYYIIELAKTKFANDEYYDTSTGLWDTTLKKSRFDVVFNTKDNVAELISHGGLDFRLNKTEFTLEDDAVFPKAIIISDKTFDGKTKKITFMTDYDFHYDFFEFRVSAINQGYYEFIQSVAAYNFNSGMFNEPIRIKSNINGGFGYFGIKTTVTDSIKISDIKYENN